MSEPKETKEPANLKELFDLWDEEELQAWHKATYNHLKELYASGDHLRDLVYKNNPFLRLIDKKDE